MGGLLPDEFENYTFFLNYCHIAQELMGEVITCRDLHIIIWNDFIYQGPLLPSLFNFNPIMDR